MSATGQGVVVTGMGATTPLGGDVATTWDGLLAGRSGVSTIDAEWVDTFELPVKIAAQLATSRPRRSSASRPGASTACEQVALVAAREAWAHADLGDYRPPRTARRRSTGSGSPSSSAPASAAR